MENKIGLDSVALKLDNILERGSFIWLVENQLRMVICRWKYFKVLQAFITFMRSGCQEVQRINSQNIFHDRCPNEIVEY